MTLLLRLFGMYIHDIDRRLNYFLLLPCILFSFKIAIIIPDLGTVEFIIYFCAMLEE